MHNSCQCVLDFHGGFFFSSRRRHTRFKCDWSSDVCSSDLAAPGVAEDVNPRWIGVALGDQFFNELVDETDVVGDGVAGLLRLPQWIGIIPFESDRFGIRSEERRVGKSVDLGGRRIIKKKKY